MDSSAATSTRFSTVSKLRPAVTHTKTSSLPSAFARAVSVSPHRIGPRTELTHRWGTASMLLGRVRTRTPMPSSRARASSEAARLMLVASESVATSRPISADAKGMAGDVRARLRQS